MGLEVFGATGTGFFGADAGGSAGAEAGEGSNWRCLFRADWTRGLGKTAVDEKGQAAGLQKDVRLSGLQIKVRGWAYSPGVHLFFALFI